MTNITEAIDPGTHGKDDIYQKIVKCIEWNINR